MKSRIIVFRTSSFGKASETFIRNQITCLPFDVHTLGTSPIALDGKPVWDGMPLPARAVQRAASRLSRRSVEEAMVDRALRSVRPDAILAQYGRGGAYILPYARRHRIPLVVHFHGVDASKHSYVKMYAEAYRQIFRHAAKVVAVSTPMARWLEHAGCPPEKIAVNPCGVDPDLFAPDPSLRLPGVFITVGRFVDKKAPHLTIAAFARVLEEFPNARLRMVGEGELLEVCQDLAIAWGVSHAIEFLGPQEPSAVMTGMKKASVFLQHSLTPKSGNQEGTPVGILEASASGLPVVSTMHAGIPEAVEDGVTGYLVPERDVEGMANRMKILLRDPKAAAEMGLRGREKVAREYNLRTQIARLAEIINTTIEQGRPGAPP